MTKLHPAKPPASPPLSPLPSVTLHEGEPVTTSLAVAAHFEKRHDHVLRSIEKLIEECNEPNLGLVNAPKIGGVEPVNESKIGLVNELKIEGVEHALKEFIEPNFRLSSYVDPKGEQRPMYLLTKDGFALLTMGFTGAKALHWKIAYIKAFNAMAKELAGQHRVQAQGEGLRSAAREQVGPHRLHTICLALACTDGKTPQSVVAWCCSVSRHVVSRILKKYAYLRPLADTPIYRDMALQRKLDYEVMCEMKCRRLPQ